MSTNKQIIVAFDLYGTLLSTASIADELSQHFGEDKAQSVAALWRRYQLEYTWRLNSMNLYEPFSTITCNSLVHAITESGLELDSMSIESLMRAYDSLSTFSDVGPALVALSSHSNIQAVVFSNGTDSMVNSSVKLSPDLGPHASTFSNIITVEEIRKFKPSPDVYFHLADKLGREKNTEQMGDMWLVSGNPFDVLGGRAVGMQAAWVDRAGHGWTDQLVQGVIGKPTVIVKDLGEVAGAIIKYVS